MFLCLPLAFVVVDIGVADEASFSGAILTGESILSLQFSGRLISCFQNTPSESEVDLTLNKNCLRPDELFGAPFKMLY